MKRVLSALLILYLLINQFTTLYANGGVAPIDPIATTAQSTLDEMSEADTEMTQEPDGRMEADTETVPDEIMETDVDTVPDGMTEANVKTVPDERTEADVETVPDEMTADSETLSKTLNLNEEPLPIDEPSTEEPILGEPILDEPLIIQPPEIIAEAAVLIDAETGLVLYDKNKDALHYPASITKVMTALLTLEMCEDLNDTLTFSHNAIYSLPRDASHIAMNEGETLTLYDALNGLLLASANEVANALAEHINFTNEDFAELMNKRAASLGAVNTHFENPSGLFTTDHSTTAYDMALIMREAVKYPVFNEIIAKRRYDIPPTEKQESMRELLNTNRLIQPGSYYNEWVIGGKTGYTDEAQHTLVNYAVKDGRALIAVVMRDEKWACFTDTNNLFEYGFSLPFEERMIFDASAYSRVLPVYQNVNDTRTLIGEVTVRGSDNISFMLPAGFDTAQISYDLSVPAELSPPVTEGDEIGSVTCYVQGVKAGRVSLTADKTIQRLTPAATRANPVLAEIQAEPITEEAPAPDPYAWDKDYFATLIGPLAISAIALLLSVVAYAVRRHRRRAKIFQFEHYTRYNDSMYRYKS